MNMITKHPIVKSALACTVLASTALSLTAVEPTLEPVKFETTWNDLKEEMDGFSIGGFDTTSIILYLNGESAPIVAYNSSDFIIDTCEDDKGKQLNFEASTFPRYSKNKKHMQFNLNSKETLPKDSSAIILKGSLTYTTAHKTKTIKTKAVKLSTGSEIKIGENLDFSISKTEKPSWGDEKWQITFKWGKDIPEIAAVRFYDASGKLINHKESGSSSTSRNGKKTSVSRSYKFKEIIKSGIVEIDVWQDMEKKTIKLDSKIGLGGIQ